VCAVTGQKPQNKQTHTRNQIKKKTKKRLQKGKTVVDNILACLSRVLKSLQDYCFRKSAIRLTPFFSVAFCRPTIGADVRKNIRQCFHFA